jgi:hypothetical protein
MPKDPSPYHPLPLFPLPGEREEGEGSWGEGFSRDHGSTALFTALEYSSSR